MFVRFNSVSCKRWTFNKLVLCTVSEHSDHSKLGFVVQSLDIRNIIIWSSCIVKRKINVKRVDLFWYVEVLVNCLKMDINEINFINFKSYYCCSWLTRGCLEWWKRFTFATVLLWYVYVTNSPVYVDVSFLISFSKSLR